LPHVAHQGGVRCQPLREALSHGTAGERDHVEARGLPRYDFLSRGSVWPLAFPDSAATVSCNAVMASLGSLTGVSNKHTSRTGTPSGPCQGSGNRERPISPMTADTSLLECGIATPLPRAVEP